MDYRRNPCRGWRPPGADLIACPGGIALKISDCVGLNGMFSGSSRVHFRDPFERLLQCAFARMQPYSLSETSY